MNVFFEKVCQERKYKRFVFLFLTKNCIYVGNCQRLAVNSCQLKVTDF